MTSALTYSEREVRDALLAGARIDIMGSPHRRGFNLIHLNGLTDTMARAVLTGMIDAGLMNPDLTLTEKGRSA